MQVAECELSSLAAVRQLAARLLETENRLELLVNCAGVPLLCLQYSFKLVSVKQFQFYIYINSGDIKILQVSR